MKKIFIKQGIQMGSTIGAFMYAYYIAFKEGGYRYTFEATKEGMGTMAALLKEAGHEIIWEQ